MGLLVSGGVPRRAAMTGAQHGIRQAVWRSVLDVLAEVAMVLLAAIILWTPYRRPQPPPPSPAAKVAPPTQPVSLDGLSLLGAPGAKAALLIFSDFQCPYCARFASETMPVLKKRYVDTGLARIAFRHLPLAIHNRATRAAESAECAARQGQFWAMHDALFKSPTHMEEFDLTSHAADIGLDRNIFAACMKDPPLDRIRHDSELADGLQFRTTPSFIIGTLEGDALRATSVVVGARSVDVFEEALDEIAVRR